jgi:hypothetical protein
MQKILFLTTEKDGLRNEVISWGNEDADCVQDAFFDRLGTKNEYQYLNDIPVGLCGGMKYMVPNYPTVLHAMGAGWRLMGLPEKEEWVDSEGESRTWYVWMLEASFDNIKSR